MRIGNWESGSKSQNSWFGAKTVVQMVHVLEPSNSSDSYNAWLLVGGDFKEAWKKAPGTLFLH